MKWNRGCKSYPALSGFCGKHRSEHSARQFYDPSAFSAVQRRSSLHKCGSTTPLLVPTANNGCKFSVSVGTTSTLQPLSYVERTIVLLSYLSALFEWLHFTSCYLLLQDDCKWLLWFNHTVAVPQTQPTAMPLWLQIGAGEMSQAWQVMEMQHSQPVGIHVPSTHTEALCAGAWLQRWTLTFFFFS